METGFLWASHVFIISALWYVLCVDFSKFAWAHSNMFIKKLEGEAICELNRIIIIMKMKIICNLCSGAAPLVTGAEAIKTRLHEPRNGGRRVVSCFIRQLAFLFTPPLAGSNFRSNCS